MLLSALALALACARLPERSTPRCQVEVRSVPAGAEVTLNQEQMGLSDVLFPVPPGRVDVVLRKKGYREVKASVDASPSRTALVCFDLAPETGTLKVSGDSLKDGALWLGPGSPRKLEPRGELSLAPGLYEVWGSRQGRQTTRKTVTVGARKEVSVALAFPEAPPPPVPAPVSRPVPTAPAEPIRPAWTPPAAPAWRPPAYSPPPRPVAPPMPVFTPIAEPPAPPPPSEPGSLFTPVP